VCAGVFFGDFHPESRRILIVGTLRDPAEMVAALRADEFDVVHACTAPSPRGVPGADVAKAARELGCDEVYVHDTVDAACAAAMSGADADDAILACGSVYVAGAARGPLRHLAN
jgi:dihydrofolate synthase/folylpolyglutamate synthase